MSWYTTDIYPQPRIILNCRILKSYGNLGFSLSRILRVSLVKALKGKVSLNRITYRKLTEYILPFDVDISLVVVHLR